MANTYYKMLNNKITNPQGDVLNRYVENVIQKRDFSPALNSVKDKKNI